MALRMQLYVVVSSFVLAGTHASMVLDSADTAISIKTKMMRRERSDQMSEIDQNHAAAESSRPHRAIINSSGPPQFDVSSVLQGCGSVCDTSVPYVSKGHYFDFIQKPIDCMALYSNTDSDAPASAWPPPTKWQLPDALVFNYSMGNQMEMADAYYEQRTSGASIKNPVWQKKTIDDMIAAADKGTFRGNYGVGPTEQAHAMRKKHAADIQGKHFYVIGSQTPWLEALLLKVGAKHVTTIEYGKINSEDPRVSTMRPDEVRRVFLESKGAEPKFDGGATFSSIEHSGLGRYGDRLNPWGDLQAMAKAWCITKANGPMYIGVPHASTDKIFYNAHRVYGPKRYPQLMANWIQTDTDAPPLFKNAAQFGAVQDMVAFVRGDGPAGAVPSLFEK